MSEDNASCNEDNESSLSICAEKFISLIYRSMQRSSVGQHVRNVAEIQKRCSVIFSRRNRRFDRKAAEGGRKQGRTFPTSVSNAYIFLTSFRVYVVSTLGSLEIISAR